MLLIRFNKNLANRFGGEDFEEFFKVFSFSCYGNQKNNKTKTLFCIVSSQYHTVAFDEVSKEYNDEIKILFCTVCVPYHKNASDKFSLVPAK